MRTSVFSPFVLSLFVLAIGCSDTEENTSTTSMTETGTVSTLNETGINTSTSTTTSTSVTTEFPDPTYGLSDQTIMHDKVERQYKLYVPKSYDGTVRFPVVLNFHGFGGNSNEQMGVSDMRSLAEEKGFILIYPQGTLLDGFTHWNTYSPGGENKSEADDFGFVEAMLDELSLNYALDAGRVYATGYSNGGDFTYTLACMLSDRVTGIAPVSGLLWYGTVDECDMKHPTAVVSFHGTADDVRPYDDGYPGYLYGIEDSTAYFNDLNGITDSGTMTSISGNIERYDYVGGDGGVTHRHYKFINGGHIWLSVNDEGSQTDEIIWEYLSQFDAEGMR